jgi:hypothetical protein
MPEASTKNFVDAMYAVGLLLHGIVKDNVGSCAQ